MGKPKNFDKSQHSWMSTWRGSIEDRVVCPYNPKHVMPYRRLVLHIIPCAQKHPELAATFLTCPYNSLHRFPPQELEGHLKICAEHQISVLTRVASGKKPYIEKYHQGSTNVNPPSSSVDKTEEMRQLEAEWQLMM